MYRAVTSAAPAPVSTPHQDIATSPLSDSLASSQGSVVSARDTTGGMTCDADTTIDTGASSVAEHAGDAAAGVSDSRTKTSTEALIAFVKQFGLNGIHASEFVTTFKERTGTALKLSGHSRLVRLRELMEASPAVVVCGYEDPWYCFAGYLRTDVAEIVCFILDCGPGGVDGSMFARRFREHRGHQLVLVDDSGAAVPLLRVLWEHPDVVMFAVGTDHCFVHAAYCTAAERVHRELRPSLDTALIAFIRACGKEGVPVSLFAKQYTEYCGNVLRLVDDVGTEITLDSLLTPHADEVVLIGPPSEQRYVCVEHLRGAAPIRAPSMPAAAAHVSAGLTAAVDPTPPAAMQAPGTLPSVPPLPSHPAGPIPNSKAAVTTVQQVPMLGTADTTPHIASHDVSSSPPNRTSLRFSFSMLCAACACGFSAMAALSTIAPALLFSYSTQLGMRLSQQQQNLGL